MRTAVVPASDSDSQFDKTVRTQTERHIVVIFRKTSDLSADTFMRIQYLNEDDGRDFYIPCLR